jgi:hypothetical protein
VLHGASKIGFHFLVFGLRRLLAMNIVGRKIHIIFRKVQAYVNVNVQAPKERLLWRNQNVLKVEIYVIQVSEMEERL